MTYSKINDLAPHNQAIASALEAALKRVLASGWYALGPEVERFEEQFAAYCGVAHCCGLANGTDAIELALKALGVEPGTEVITAANAGMYSATAILAIGAKPVYADIDPGTFTIDPAHAATRITPKTSAIVATHLYGRMADMPALRQLADKHRIPLLEDCAQAHGAMLDDKRGAGKPAGSWGDAAAFSFYPTKNLGALGDGGATVTNDQEVHDRVTQLRQYGWESKYQVVRSGGRNSRLDEVQAAFLNVKLEHLNTWTRKRQELGQFYCRQINNPAVSVSPYAGVQHVYHLYVLRSKNRDALIAHLGSKCIATAVHYPLLDYQQPLFCNDAEVKKIRLPHSEQAVNEILTIPCYPELSIDDASFVVDAINDWKSQ